MNLFDKIFKKSLPKVGSTFTYRNKKSCYNGWTGIVFHHLGGDSFGIDMGNRILCNIK